MSEVYTIQRITDAPSFGPTGGVVMMKRVSFTVGDHGPFAEDFRPAEFNELNIRNRLTAVADVIRKATT